VRNIPARAKLKPSGRKRRVDAIAPLTLSLPFSFCHCLSVLRFFNAHTFKLEEKCYQDERIKFDHVAYIDNQPVLDLIESVRRAEGEGEEAPPARPC